MSYRKDYLEALENESGYDYIAQNYDKFSKSELKDIILELDYAISCAERHCFESAKDCYESASAELLERWNMNCYIVDECDTSVSYDDLEEFLQYFFVEDYVKEDDVLDAESFARYKKEFAELKEFAERAVRLDDWEAMVETANKLADLEVSAHHFVVKEK